MTSFTPPTVGAFDAPTVALSLNAEWLSFVLGSLETFQLYPEYAHRRAGMYATLQDDIWNGDETTVYTAEQQIEAILNALAKGNITMIPTGTIQPILSETIPDGWLKCDGSQYNEADYPALFAALPAAFKSGSNFVVPNLTGRSLIGDGGAYALGGVGGEASHSLTIDEIPAHSHDVDAHEHSIPSHTHTAQPHTHTTNPHAHTLDTRTSSTGFGTGRPAQSNGTGVEGGWNTQNATVTVNNATVTIDSAPATVTGSASPATNYRGGNGAHNNMPPYFVVTFIIKV